MEPSKNEKLKELFASHPKTDRFFITTDMTAFFEEQRAVEHARSLAGKDVASVSRATFEKAAQINAAIQAEAEAKQKAAAEQAELEAKQKAEAEATAQAEAEAKQKAAAEAAAKKKTKTAKA